jgi:acetyl-CoA synthetase
VSVDQRPEIENLLAEGRTFPPDPAFAGQANAQRSLYDEAARDPEAFWARIARETVTWNEPFTTTLEWDLPFAKWFTGGKLNISENCVDRHVANGLGREGRYHWIGEPGGPGRSPTRPTRGPEAARAPSWGRKGDRVAIYMPMIPELPIAMLACARSGAHTRCSSRFFPRGARGRINDAEAKLVITADGGWRPRQADAAQAGVDEAIPSTPSAARAWSARLGDAARTSGRGRDHWWHDIVDASRRLFAAARSTAEHMLYLLYTSGSTAKPKGIFHSTAGYLLGTSYSHEMIFDVKPDDVYWCAADVGWVTGHSYIVYGPLANATTGVMYEGTPDTPAWDRWWQIIEDYKVSILYCAPTAIRAFMKQGAELPAKHDLSSLRVLGSVGEPINPEAWLWYREHIGGNKAPVVDTWWQTETGQILITPLPGRDDDEARQRDLPVPGHQGRRRRRRRQVRAVRRRRLPRPEAARGRRCSAASTATRALQGRRTGAASRDVLRRRRRQARRRRLLLAPRPGRRRDERLGPSLSTTEIESALCRTRPVAERRSSAVRTR